MHDPYITLDINHQATEEEINKAYKKLAFEHHPDRNNGDKESTEKFKEINEAYQALTNKNTHQNGFGFSRSNINGDSFDFFNSIFNSMFNNQRNQDGRSIESECEITLEEAYSGCKKDISVNVPIPCEACSGKGGHSRKPCRHCAGSGQQKVQNGFLVFLQTCSVCRGEGTVIDGICESCNGARFESGSKVISVDVPAGVSTGNRLRVVGCGYPSQVYGHQPGDLYVNVKVKNHDKFVRTGNDLLYNLYIDYPDAVLGSDNKIKFIDGSEIDIHTVNGVHDGDVIKIKNKGMKYVNCDKYGDLCVVVKINIPQRVNDRLRKILADLKEEFHT